MRFVDAVKLLTKHPGHINMELVGTQYIFGKGNDTDILWEVAGLNGAGLMLGLNGFVRDGGVSGGDAAPGSHWQSWRHDKCNVIVTTDGGWFLDFLTAAKVCKYLQLESKEQRKAVHKIIRDGADVTDDNKVIA